MARDIVETLEEMQQYLRETVKEASALSRVAIEEEVLTGAEKINKTCSHMLRDTKRIENRLKHSSLGRKTR